MRHPFSLDRITFNEDKVWIAPQKVHKLICYTDNIYEWFQMEDRQMKDKEKIKNKTKYSAEFRRQAVEHYLSTGRTQKEIAENLGVSASALIRWIQEYRNERDGGDVREGFSEEARKEILRLKEEVRVLRLEREILKKAARFFANEGQERSLA
jgi:transposase